MEKKEFTDRHIDIIRRFVNAPEFGDIKDAFVSHTPERGKDGREEDSDSKNLGKLLGTRYVFNELEQISKSMPQRNQNNNNRNNSRRSEQDPDLAT